MKLLLASVGAPGQLLGPAIAEYETRAARYWPLEVVEVKAERARKGTDDESVREAETRRLLDRVDAGLDVVAMTRHGRTWSSTALARYLADLALHGPGAAFLIGGALGLHEGTLPPGARRFSLGNVTLPHELARLVLAEQIYRAGTIVRGEPYHKG